MKVGPSDSVFRNGVQITLELLHVVGYLKGKSAIAIARRFRGKQRNFTGENCWARGYFVSTVGLDEQAVREYIKHQEDNDAKHEQKS